MNIEENTSLNLKEAYTNLHTSLGDNIFNKYNALLNQFFSAKVTKIKFDEDARKLLSTAEQIHLHNLFLFALTEKLQPSSRLGYDDFPSDSENNLKYAVQERYVPDEDLIRTRVLVTSYQHDLDGAEDDVTKIIVIATKLFLKNILTSIISKCSGYKIREDTFQHNIGCPVPDPWLRNYNNIIDDSQESNLEINEEQCSIQPAIRNTLEAVQQQSAYAYSCTSKEKVRGSKKISLMSLYETLIEDPSVISNHTIYSINLERILAKLDHSHL